MSMLPMNDNALPVEERLIVGLDTETIKDARAVVSALGDTGRHYKIGHRLQFTGGLELTRELVQAGKRVFLDVKLHDIPNTVANGITSIAALGVGFVTVHAYPQTLTAAVAAARSTSIQILGVTVLTSMDDDDLTDAGYAHNISQLAILRAQQARTAGAAGLICSAHEAATLRPHCGHQMALITPGIRPAGSNAGDQKRVMTPGEAIASGADYLVVARPILNASDPKQIARSIIDDMERALQTRG